MANYPENLRYSKEHEWLEIKGNTALIGVTEYATEQLGDVVHVELPDVDAEYGKDDAIGVVESVKSVSDVFTPVSCKVLEVNESLLENPDIINHEPYTEGWFVKVELTEPGEVDGLMSAEDYEKFLSEEA